MQRVSTYGMMNGTLASALALQSRYAKTNAQNASGLVSSNYADLGAQASTLISLESSTTRTTAWKTNTNIAHDRVEAMWSSLGGMTDILTNLRATITTAQSAAQGSVALNTAGSNALNDLASAMNTQLDGRYLFGGSLTDTLPVDTTALTPITSVPSTANNSYYQGDSVLSSVRVSDQQSITYGVTANGTGFEKALRAANILANMTTSPLDTAALDEAYQLATDALDALTAQRSAVSINQSRLESSLQAQTNSLGLLDTMASDIKAVDVGETTAKMNSYQTQLQASYASIASVYKLSLANYL